MSAMSLLPRGFLLQNSKPNRSSMSERMPQIRIPTFASVYAMAYRDLHRNRIKSCRRPQVSRQPKDSAELKQHSHINQKAHDANQDPEFSRRIRDGIPGFTAQ